jgi:hypothetical protein
VDRGIKNIGGRPLLGRYGPSRKKSDQEIVFGFTALSPPAIVRAMPSIKDGTQFGLLQYVGHVRPE